jgi:deoxyribose-phosphate aldolase
VSNIARYIDHTLLKPAATHIEINRICKEAMEYGFAAVCIPPMLVGLAKGALAGGPVSTVSGLVRSAAAGSDSGALTAGAKDSRREAGRDAGGPKVATVIGFPFGYSATSAKLAEVEQALSDGADELDVVINLIDLKNGDWGRLEKEMELLTERIHAGGKIVKVIVESGILSDVEIVKCCEVYSRVGVDFLKTSTGYAEKGATVEAVRLMREHLPETIRIKASGGIRTYAFAQQLIDAGADRLGCSASVEIVKMEMVAPGGY